MANSTVDALGYEEIGQVGSQVASLWMTGSLVVEGGIQNTLDTSGTNVFAAGSVQANEIIADNSFILTSTQDEGIIAKGWNAEAIITGGMWVVGSVASGASPTVVIKPAATSEEQPLGICLATVASGATTEVLVKGPYKGLIAEAAVSVADTVKMGAGAALNTIAATASGTDVYADLGKGRATVLMAGGSEAETVVYLW